MEKLTKEELLRLLEEVESPPLDDLPQSPTPKYRVGGS